MKQGPYPAFYSAIYFILEYSTERQGQWFQVRLFGSLEETAELFVREKELGHLNVKKFLASPTLPTSPLDCTPYSPTSEVCAVIDLESMAASYGSSSFSLEEGAVHFRKSPLPLHEVRVTIGLKSCLDYKRNQLIDPSHEFEHNVWQRLKDKSRRVLYVYTLGRIHRATRDCAG